MAPSKLAASIENLKKNREKLLFKENEEKSQRTKCARRIDKPRHREPMRCVRSLALSRFVWRRRASPGVALPFANYKNELSLSLSA